MRLKLKQLAVATVSAGLCACAGTTMSSMTEAARAIPAAIAVPAGHIPHLFLMGVGEISYECRAQGVATREVAKQDGFEWAFAGASALLYDMNKAVAGKYTSGPTWEANDGSRLTGKQLAVAPAAPGNLAWQLVQANPAMGVGLMQGVTYVQRVNARGGTVLGGVCDGVRLGKVIRVKYEADYIFYKK
jgi:Protein of unknown function (DUF3455)